MVIDNEIINGIEGSKKVASSLSPVGEGRGEGLSG
jgi:hypothetical protein